MTANRKAIFALALGLSAAVTACDSAAKLDQITAPPAFSQGPKEIKLVQTSVQYGGCVYAYVNPSGGTIEYNSGTTKVLALMVPKRALAAQTYFVVCPTTDGTLGFTFRAVDRYGKSITTFQIPLRLTMSYAAGTGIVATDRINIVYVVNGAALESLGGAVDRVNKTVSGNVFHFSTYVIGTD